MCWLAGDLDGTYLILWVHWSGLWKMLEMDVLQQFTGTGFVED
jgi:hypothetical protein